MTDIVGERKKLAAQGLEIVARETWGARQSYTSARACDVPAVAFFLHISVTELAVNEHAGMRTIEAIGQARFGIGCSYNAAVFPSGRLYEAQPLTRRGAHTVNNFERPVCPAHGGSLAAPGWNNNVNARALVLPQMVDDPVTDAQVDAAARWAAAQIRAGLAVRGARWHGHRCVTAKDCPGEEAFRRIPELQRLTDRYAADGLIEPAAAPDPMKEFDMFLASVPGADPRIFLCGPAGKREVTGGASGAVFKELKDKGIPHVGDLSSAALNMFPTLDGVLERIVDVDGGLDATRAALAEVRAELTTIRTVVEQLAAAEPGL